MDLKAESGLLFLSFGDRTVTYRGRAYPTGSIACMALNIDHDSLEAAQPLCRKLASVNQMLRTGVADKAQMNSARMAAHALLSLISKHEPFSFLGKSELDQRLDAVYTIEAFRKIHAYQSTLLAGKLDEVARQKYSPTIDLLHLTPALANFVDAVTLLQGRIGPFVEKLDAERCLRTKEGYLTRFAEAFPENFTLGDGGDSWLAMTNVTVQYVAGRPEEKEEMQMIKQMHFLSFSSMLRADFFEGLSVGHAPKRCANCGRWFLTTDARRTKYCGGLAPADPRGRTCR